MSLRRRIILLTMGVGVLTLLVFAVPLVLLLQQSARDSAVRQATDVAQGVADYVSTSSDPATLSAYVNRVNDRDDDDDVKVAVDLPNGVRLGATSEDVPRRAPDGREVDGDFDHDDDDDRFSPTSSAQVYEVDGGRLVTVTVRGEGGSAVVSAFVSGSAVGETVRSRLVIVAVAAASALILAAIAAELVTRRLVRSLTDTAQTADRLSRGDLAARAPEQGPAEVVRVAAALNRLAVRIDELLLAERETVADLSHRLRTPLTAVRLDVEALPDSPERAELADHLDLLERTLTAVIRAARRPEREGAAPSCDAAIVVRERVAFWSPLMEDQGRPVRTLIDDPLALVRCTAEDLAAALDALLENVVAHTPEGTEVEVHARVESGYVVVEVRDRGPGIPEASVRRGRSDRGSSGLGVDIARSCAEATGGKLTITRADGWSIVRMDLGVAQVPHRSS